MTNYGTTIIVTHHPHVLFSKDVNQVVYIETLGKADTEPKKVVEIKNSDTFHASSPKREIRELSTDFEKISSVYGLFSQQDCQLLQLACLMDEVIEIEFAKQLLNFIEKKFPQSVNNKLAQEKENIQQNTEGKQFRELIKISSCSNFKFLDFGVSQGRIFEEFMKSPCAEVEWHFWNPQKEDNQKLEELKSKYEDVNIKVIESEEEISQNFYDFAVLSNWLHLLTPLEIAHTLKIIQKSLKESSGELIILEHCPLIARQMYVYAVPYDENTLLKILRSVGWKCESGKVDCSAEYISAYWIRAYQPNKEKVFDVTKNAEEIRKHWHEDIKPRVCSDYNDISRMPNAQRFLRFMNDFKTIMSIINEEQKIWQSTLGKDSESFITQPQTQPAPHPQLEPVTHESKKMHILHLSDLHFSQSGHLRLKLEDQAEIWSSKLVQDLRNNFKLTQIDVLILSGDITHYSTSEEYAAAKKFLNNLRENFPIKREQIVIVPGNHDLNWDKSKDAYQVMRLEEYKGPKISQDGKDIPDPNCTIYDGGNYVEVQNEEKYKQRFVYFSDFYKDIKGEPYPIDYDQQAIIHHLSDLNLLILGLNSAWDLNHDEKKTKRASINMTALSNTIAEIGRNRVYQNCLKIAVWHHPVRGLEMMHNSFMQSLADDGFQVCLHGHIHEAQEDFYKYDNTRGLSIIGAGTFGAPVKEQVTGIPLQYHLLELDLQNWQLTVNTRRKEKIDGAWSADPRWGDKNNPSPKLVINLRKLAENP
jgi:predicted MPP superfamily phosphohydrolase